MNEVEVWDLGRAGYREVWERQTALQQECIACKLKGERGRDCLLFVEHPHVYTLGKSGDEANMLMNAIQLRAKHAEFIHVDRGGDITYHGPGQLVVYPIFDIEHFHFGVKEYVHALEEVVIRTVGDYGIRAERLEGATGVWLDAHAPGARKICAIGIKCSHYVTMHGFALNVNTDLKYFHYIHPCGFRDKGVTSIAKEVGYTVSMMEVKEKVLTHFYAVFGAVCADGCLYPEDDKPAE